MVTALDGATYRGARFHLKPYNPTASCSNAAYIKTRTTQHMQENHKQVSMQTGEDLRCLETYLPCLNEPVSL